MSDEHLMPKDNSEYQFQSYWEGRYTKYDNRQTLKFDSKMIAQNLTSRALALGTLEPMSGSKDGPLSDTS